MPQIQGSTVGSPYNVLEDLDVFEQSPVGMIVTDRTGCFRRVNQAFATLVGRNVEDLVGVPFASLTSRDDIERSQQVMRQLLCGQAQTARFDKHYERPDGSLVWVDMSVRALAGDDGDVAGFLAHAMDISARKETERRYRQQAMLFDAIFDAVFVSDAQGTLEDCNRAAERLTGLNREKLLEYGRDRAAPDQAVWVRRMRTAIANGGWAGDVTFETGQERRIAETTIVVVRDANGAVAGGIAICRDVTEARDNARALVHAEQRARHDAGHDPLTGLPNRKLLADRFHALFEVANAPAGAALLMIDLDRFKDVNDTLGHHCGDELLVQVGRVLQAAVREMDVAARLGGDEFAILLPGVTDRDTAMALADRVRGALEQPFRVEGIDLDVEASIGVAIAGARPDITDLLRQADVAMYVAKGHGVGVFAYDPSVDGHSPARLSLLGELRGAMKREELLLYFQPKIKVGTGEVIGAEALLRWQHPVRGLIPPDDFIPLAEHTGLIRPLTQYVIDAALAEERRWIDAGRPLPISVNLSARNLLEERLVEQITDKLRRHNVPATLLELELTESSIVTDPLRASTLLGRLRRLGIRVSIDDFGAGFTSLAVLKSLPVSELKIDRSFIESMTRRTNDALIVRSVVQLSHNLGLDAVAEGVENEDVLEALRAIGCDIAQGYHLSRPLPAELFAAWYERYNGHPPATG